MSCTWGTWHRAMLDKFCSLESLKGGALEYTCDLQAKCNLDDDSLDAISAVSILAATSCACSLYLCSRR